MRHKCAPKKRCSSNLRVVAARVGECLTVGLDSFRSARNYICIQQTRPAWHASDISRANQIRSLQSQQLLQHHASLPMTTPYHQHQAAYNTSSLTAKIQHHKIFYYVLVIITARSELRKVLFLAPSVCGFCV